MGFKGDSKIKMQRAILGADELKPRGGQKSKNELKIASWRPDCRGVGPQMRFDEVCQGLRGFEGVKFLDFVIFLSLMVFFSRAVSFGDSSI